MSDNGYLDETGRTLEQYRDDPAMLDAFWQWANGSFARAGQGKHAWAQERAYGFFVDNLSLRYGLNLAEAEAIGTKLEEACKALVGNNEFDAKKAVIEALSGDLGEPIRGEISRRVDGASLSARCLLASYNFLVALPEHQHSAASYSVMVAVRWEQFSGQHWAACQAQR